MGRPLWGEGAWGRLQRADGGGVLEARTRLQLNVASDRPLGGRGLDGLFADSGDVAVFADVHILCRIQCTHTTGMQPVRLWRHESVQL